MRGGRPSGALPTSAPTLGKRNHALKEIHRLCRDATTAARTLWVRDKRSLLVALVLLTLTVLMLGVARPLPRLVAATRKNPYAGEGSIDDLEELLRSIAGDNSKPSEVLLPGAKPVPSVETSRGNVTILAVNYAYRELAMNLICNLERLNMSNYLVLAMDRAAYRYIADRGGHVFYHSVYETLTDIGLKQDLGAADADIPPGLPDEESEVGDDTTEGHLFGSSEFVYTSRRKSMMVAEVVMLGYDVLFCDADLALLQNPMPRFEDYAEDFLIMSDRAPTDVRRHINYNINSGFYFVRGRPRNFLALRAIVKFGRKQKRSEQKAFNHVLCGAFKDIQGGPGRRVGYNRCYYETRGSVITRVLPSMEFLNGGDTRLFDFAPSQVDDLRERAYAIHVNYVEGRDQKIDRLRRLGLWHYSGNGEVRGGGCMLHPDQRFINHEPSEPSDRVSFLPSSLLDVPAIGNNARDVADEGVVSSDDLRRERAAREAAAAA